MQTLFSCQAAPYGNQTRVKRSLSWEASLSLHVSNLKSQAGESYMTNEDRGNLVNALSEIKSHLRAEQLKVEHNGWLDLVSRVLICTVGLVLTLGVGLARCQDTLKSGLQAIRGSSQSSPSAPAVIYGNPRPLIASAGFNTPLQ